MSKHNAKTGLPERGSDPFFNGLLASMPVAHEDDYHRRVSDVRATRFLKRTSIEIIREVVLDSPPLYAIFDFDGTLSLIREGWPDVMIPMMVEVLRETGTDETIDELTALVTDFVMDLTGKQTIYQMMRLTDELSQRGGKPEDPLEYKHKYHNLLMHRIAKRREQLRSGTASPDDMWVPGSREVLQGLRARNVQLFLASGTDEIYVKEEVDLLGLTDFFGDHIYGAVDDFKSFSKQKVIERILQENKVDGSRLLGFGDGYVEIDNVKSVGGTAVAVASDESGRSGKPDSWKRERLIGVGADVVVPDFRACDVLLKYLWNEG